ncbi:MAG: cobalt-zinc-cadmium efflux system outer membrane protein, partial [Zhongshania aliphaticivorans]
MLAMPTRPSFGVWNRRVLSARCILCCLLFVFSSGLSAAPPALSLADAVQRSLAQNPRLKVFPFRAAALQGQAETAQLRPAYELGVDAENLGGSGEFAGVDGAELTVALSSVIEMGDKRAARQGLVSNS